MEERTDFGGLYGYIGDGFWDEAASESGRVMAERKSKKTKTLQDPDEEIGRATSQHQHRMIKNRESAARSRERKQAYTLELESMVQELKDENAELIRQQVDDSKKRLKQLIETLIPVEEMSRPPRRLRKTQSI